MAIRGLTDGLSVTAGQAITNLAVSKIPFGQATPVGQNALKLAVGLVGAMGVKKFTKSDRVAAFYLAGVTNDIYRHLFAGVPVVGAALAGVGTYPMLTAGRVGTYPRPRALSGYAGAVDGAVVEQYDSSDQHDEDSDQFAVASH